MRKSKLAEVRVSAGFRTPESASGVVGLSAVYIRNMECGRTPITGNALVKLADGYRIGVDELRRRIGMAPRQSRGKRNGKPVAA